MVLLMHKITTNNQGGIKKKMNYGEILEQLESAQKDLMMIDDYSEEVYQGIAAAIQELEYLIEELEAL